MRCLLPFTTLIDICGGGLARARPTGSRSSITSCRCPQNQRIRVKIAVTEDEIVPSITDLHPSANWFEREVFDMYGVMFSGHPDLRRLLTDYGFRGHPLRKDFPTDRLYRGPLRRDAETGRLRTRQPRQEYRQFDFMKAHGKGPTTSFRATKRQGGISMLDTQADETAVRAAAEG